MKLLIIDDEAGSREVIKILINLNTIGFDEILEADNGRSGMAMIEKHKPDVIITDMKMPEMDGISLLEALDKSSEKFRIIVISGFSDFEYTRAAIRTKVIDYILKPVKKEELIVILKKAMKDINADTIRKPDKNELKLLTDFFSDNQANDNVLTKDLIESYLDQEENDGDNNYLILIIKIINMDEIKDAFFNGYQELLIYSVEENIRSFYSNRTIVIPNEKKREILVIASANDKVFNSEKEAILLDAKKLLELLQVSYKMDCITIIYHCFISKKDLIPAYRGLKQTLRNYNLLDHNKIRIQNESYSDSIIGNYSMGDKSAFANILFNYDSRQAEQYIEDIFRNIYLQGNITINDLNFLCIEFLNIISGCVSEKGLDAGELFNRIQKEGSIVRHSGSLTEIKAWMLMCCKYTIELLYKARLESCSSVLKDILKYVDTYYYEMIDLDLLSKKFFLSKGHISRLFKYELNENFVEYRTKVRLYKAEELMKDSALTLQYISDAVGFSDVSYFSKSFKKQYGISPEEYRNR